MSDNKIEEHQIQVGVPLPFDAFDANGQLLLRRGQVLQTADQLSRLLERGLFRDPQELAAHAKAGEERARFQHAKGTRRSAIGQLGEIQHELEQWLTGTAPPEQLMALAAGVRQACQIDADASIASIQLLHAGRHSVRRMMQTAVLTALLQQQLNSPEAVQLAALAASMTMNISTLDLQDQLCEQAEAPSPQAQEKLKSHPQEGMQMLQARGVTDALWLQLVLQHHEKIDGSGYPSGLQGSDIHEAAQVISLADRYGSMATGRAYRPPALPSMVLKQIFQDKDKTVDARLVSLLVKTVGVYPPGSLVVLATGDIAMVVKRTQSANHPVVKVLKTAKGLVLEAPRKRLTSEPAYAIQRLMNLAQLEFQPDPETLWDEGITLDATAPPQLAT